MYVYSFEKLEVWKIARKVRNEIYKISVDFPDHEKYVLTSQIRRSSNSVTDNLAEGSGRATQADRAYFINQAYSSGLEVLNQLITALDQNYINELVYSDLRKEMEQLLNKLNAYYKSQINSTKSLKTNKQINR
jgi:four helix bundle protein